MIKFLSHNIRLLDGASTMPHKKILLKETNAFSEIKKALNKHLDLSQNIKYTAIDLGCMEGGFALLFAQLGFDTLGIEAREQNIEKANYLKKHFSDLKLHFVQDNVNNIKAYNNADFMFCSGILYHLDDPITFIKNIYEKTNRILYIQTFVAPKSNLVFSLKTFFNKLIWPFYKLKAKKLQLLLNSKEEHLSWSLHINTNRLSPYVTKMDNYEGRYYHEWKGTERKEDNINKLGASVNNTHSFWLTKPALLKCLADVGFKNVYEVNTNETNTNDPMLYPKVILVALK